MTEPDISTNAYIESKIVLKTNLEIIAQVVEIRNGFPYFRGHGEMVDTVTLTNISNRRVETVQSW